MPTLRRPCTSVSSRSPTNIASSRLDAELRRARGGRSRAAGLRTPTSSENDDHVDSVGEAERLDVARAAAAPAPATSSRRPPVLMPAAAQRLEQGVRRAEHGVRRTPDLVLRVDERGRPASSRAPEQRAQQLARSRRPGCASSSTSVAVPLRERRGFGRCPIAASPARCPAASSSSSHVNWTSVLFQSKRTASITARLG